MIAVATGSAAGGTLDVGMVLGLVLLAAIAGGHLARLAHVPRVVGYLVAGVALRMALTAVRGAEGAMLPPASASSLLVIKSLALGLIMFMLGGVFEVRHIRSVGRRIIRLSAAEGACVAGLVGGGCTAVWLWVSGGEPAGAVLAAGLLLGAVAWETAPAATLLVLREYDAKGPTADTALTMTAINATASIVLFHSLFLGLAAAGLIDGGSAGAAWLWADLLLTTVGSALLGGALGFLLSVLYSKVPLAEFLLLFLAALIGLAAGARFLADTAHLSFSFLLASLFLGVVFTNVTLDTGPLNDALRVIGGPTFAAFFVIAGFDLHLAELTGVGALGAAYVGLRTLGKYLGVRLGARWAQWSGEVGPHLGLALLCHAGVAIGLADLICEMWGRSADGRWTPHPVAAHFRTVVLGSVVVFELVGPLLLKGVVKAAGEVKAITLLRRRSAAPLEGDSVTRLTWDALLRTLGLRKLHEAGDPHELAVRHIMRSNIKFIRASAKLDEVLHFVEGSRYNHFPVVDEDGAFVGMIHFADLREMIYDPHMRDLVTAIDLACPDDMVPVDMRLDDLLHRFQQSDVGSLVVVESPETRRVVGLVEQRDLLRALHGGARLPDH